MTGDQPGELTISQGNGGLGNKMLWRNAGKISRYEENETQGRAVDGFV